MLPRQPMRFLLADDPGAGSPASKLGVSKEFIGGRMIFDV
jgi:hypothetical protein